MTKNHSPCIINLDDKIGNGTHWVCCNITPQGVYEYFDSFGLPPPEEWLIYPKKFIRNVFQIQDTRSVRCGYYCLLFLNERIRKTQSYQGILKNLKKNDQEYNEKFVKKYFTSI